MVIESASDTVQPSQIVLPHSGIRSFGYSTTFCGCFACLLRRESPLCGCGVELRLGTRLPRLRFPEVRVKLLHAFVYRFVRT